MYLLERNLELLCIVLCLVKASVAQYNDIRCRCTCKPLVSLAIPRKVYIQEAEQQDCNCMHVVIEQVDAKYWGDNNETGVHMEQYCIGCECVYEVRSTKTMEVVVIIYLVLVGTLLLYMVAALIADFFQKKRNKPPPIDEEQLVMEERPSTSRDASARRTRRVLRSTSSGSMVIQKLTTAQQEWRKTLRNQRDQVYSRRSILQ